MASGRADRNSSGAHPQTYPQRMWISGNSLSKHWLTDVSSDLDQMSRASVHIASLAPTA